MASGDASEVSVTITGDGSKLSSVLDELDSRLKSLESSFQSASHASEAHGTETEKTAEKAAGLTENFGKLQGATALAAEGMSTLGIEGEGASRVMGLLGETMETLGETAPAIIALGATIAALSAGFGLLKESIDAAAEAQQKFVSIGVLIRNQGGDWAELTTSVNEYAEALAKAGTFSHGDILSGMQSMLTAGVSVNDMIRSQNAAKDLAIAKSETLQEAEQQLAMAYDGRLRMMKMLGLVTAEEVKEGIPYEELLGRIESRMGGAATAELETYAGKQANLANMFEAQAKAIGDGLLPVMSDFTDMLRLIVGEMQPVTDTFVEWISKHLPELREGIAGFGRALGDLIATALPPFLAGLEIVLESLAKLGTWFVDNEPTVQYFFDTVLAAGAVAALASLTPLFAAIVEGLTTAIAFIGGTAAAIDALAVSEALATLGMSLLVAGAVLGLADLIAHWDETKDSVEGMLTDVTGAVGSMANAIGGFFDSLGKQFDNFLTSLKNSIPVIGQITTAVSNYYTQRADSEKKFDDYERAKSVVGGGPAAGIMGGGNAPLGGSAVNAGAAVPFDQLKGTAGWGSDGSGGGAADGSWSSWTSPAATTPSSHIIPGSAGAGRGAGAGAAGTTETYTPLDPYIAKTDLAAEAQARLTQRLKDLDAALDSDREAIKSATSVQDEAQAKSNLQSDTLAELAEKHKALAKAIADSTNAMPGLEAAQNMAILTNNSLVAEVNAYQHVLSEQSTPATIEQKNALAELTSKAADAKNAIADANAAVKENELITRENTNAQRENSKAMADLGNEAADAARKLDAANIASQKSWDDFTAKSIAKMHEDLATFEMTNLQKYTYYSAMLAAMGDRTVENEKDMERVYGLELSAYQGALSDQRKALEESIKEQKKAYQDYVDSVNAYTNNLIDSIVFKHESMGNILKDVFGDIEKNFVKMLEKQLESTTTFQQVTQSNLPGSAGASGGGALGLFGTILGATTGIGGASGTNPTGSSASPFYVINADSSSLQLGKLTGLPAGIDPGSVTAISNSSQSSNAATLLTNNAANSASALAGVAPMGSTAWAYSNDQPNVLGGNSAPLGGSSEGTAVVTSQLSKLIAGAIQGAEFGGLAASITGGSSTGGSVGGALGGIAGTLLHANPLIGAGIDLFGGIIGGLFGGPKANAHDNPDQFNPDYGTGVGYGQFTANWQGAPGSFNGTNVNPIAKYYTGLGGKSEEQILLASIQSTLAPNSGAAPVLLQEAAALKALERGDTASNALNIVGEKQGMYTLQSGAQVPVQQFMQMVSQYMTNSGAAGAAVPVFSISRSYPNENAAHMSADGTMPSGGVTLSNGSHITATNGASNNMLGNTINLTVNGSVVGQNGMQALADIISTNLARAGKTSPVASTQSVYGRTGAGY